MLEGNNISFRYRQRQQWVLRNLTIKVEPGRIVGLYGISGRGKTTLAKILAGYLKPVSGEVKLDNKPLPQKGYAPVQLIFQHPELAINPRLKIKQVLTEGGQDVETAIKLFDIDADWLDRYPYELSGGELQRVALARTFTSRTKYLIADEMTAMLDAVSQTQIWHIILNNMRQFQIGVLMISHDLPLMKRLCRDIVNIEDINDMD